MGGETASAAAGLLAAALGGRSRPLPGAEWCKSIALRPAADGLVLLQLPEDSLVLADVVDAAPL
jgi:hypothetical protein